MRHALQEASRRGEGSNHNGSSAGGSGSGGGSGGSSQHGSIGGSVRNGLNFNQFLRMLRSGSCDSLDLYDDRLVMGHGRAESG